MIPLVGALIAVAVLVAWARWNGTGGPRTESRAGQSAPSAGTSPTTPRLTSPPNPAMGVGVYMGSFSTQTYRATFGRYADVETTYLNADQVKVPDQARFQREIDLGISPVITLDDKGGPFTRAEIADWGPDVRAYYTVFVAGLRTLSEHARSRHDGTRVYFADEHEAAVKINQHKYTYSGYGSTGGPTVAESAAAWNRVNRYVARVAPDVVRVYWYGGTGHNEDAFADALDPDLIQMATFDLYRWHYDRATDTPQELWSGPVDHLDRQPWMRRPDGKLKPWGVTEWGTDASLGDAANAGFVRRALAFWRSEGAAFAVYFDRVDSNSSANDFVFTDGSQPRTLKVFRAALSG